MVLIKIFIKLFSYAYLCNNISSIVNGIFSKTKKCLVLDLDNTLWGGVIGDDNLNGIKLEMKHQKVSIFRFSKIYKKS